MADERLTREQAFDAHWKAVGWARDVSEREARYWWSAALSNSPLPQVVEALRLCVNVLESQYPPGDIFPPNDVRAALEAAKEWSDHG